MTSKDPPWKVFQARFPNLVPDASTLLRWRKAANKLAKAIGAKASCDLCKRPIMRRSGYVWLRTPMAWRAQPIKRRICYGCYAILQMHIEHMEATGNRDHLPPEEFDEVPQVVTEDVDVTDAA